MFCLFKLLNILLSTFIACIVCENKFDFENKFDAICNCYPCSTSGKAFRKKKKMPSGFLQGSLFDTGFLQFENGILQFNFIVVVTAIVYPAWGYVISTPGLVPCFLSLILEIFLIITFNNFVSFLFFPPLGIIITDMLHLL